MTRRAYKIGADVLDQCFRTEIDETLQTKLCLSAAETYFCCIHVFENCLKEQNGKDSKFRDDFRTYENKIVARLVFAEHFTESTYKWLMVIYYCLQLCIPIYIILHQLPDIKQKNRTFFILFHPQHPP